MLRGLLSWCSLLRINSQKFKGFAEAIGLSLLLKGVPKSFFEFAVTCGISCSYEQCINILEAKKSNVCEVLQRICYIFKLHYLGGQRFVQNSDCYLRQRELDVNRR